MFQLWEPARYAAHRAAARERSRRQGATLPPRGAPRGPGDEPRIAADARSAARPRRMSRCWSTRSLAALAPRDGAIYVDGTFGAGGYSAALLGAARCRVFGIDRDPDAVRRGAGAGRAASPAG